MISINLAHKGGSRHVRNRHHLVAGNYQWHDFNGSHDNVAFDIFVVLGKNAQSGRRLRQ